MNTKYRLLIVEDDEFIQGLLCAVLENEGFVIACASNGRELLALIERDHFDLVLLDLGLPDEDGLVLLRQMRTKSEVPVIILTSRSDVDSRVRALEIGADDFVTKPADPRELKLRITRLLARSGGTSFKTFDNVRKITVGNWILDFDSRDLQRADGHRVELTRSEFDLLAALFKAPDKILSRSILLDAISRGDGSPFDRTIDVLVSRLRKKIEDNPKKPTFIITAPSIGYKLSRSTP